MSTHRYFPGTRLRLVPDLFLSLFVEQAWTKQKKKRENARANAHERNEMNENASFTRKVRWLSRERRQLKRLCSLNSKISSFHLVVSHWKDVKTKDTKRTCRVFSTLFLVFFYDKNVNHLTKRAIRNVAYSRFLLVEGESEKCRRTRKKWGGKKASARFSLSCNYKEPGTSYS